MYGLQRSYECSQAASTGSDLELSIEIPYSASGEKALHQQQHSKHKESSCKAIDDVLEDVNTVEWTCTHPYGQWLMKIWYVYATLHLEVLTSSAKLICVIAINKPDSMIRSTGGSGIWDGGIGGSGWDYQHLHGSITHFHICLIPVWFISTFDPKQKT